MPYELRLLISNSVSYYNMNRHCELVMLIAFTVPDEKKLEGDYGMEQSSTYTRHLECVCNLSINNQRAVCRESLLKIRWNQKTFHRYTTCELQRWFSSSHVPWYTKIEISHYSQSVEYWSSLNIEADQKHEYVFVRLNKKIQFNFCFLNWKYSNIQGPYPFIPMRLLSRRW